MVVTIVGAGMAGLTAAAELQANGWMVVLLDKGRKAGGRMATRRFGESRFDHGAQFFTVRDDRFREAVNQWESSHWIEPWFVEGGHPRYKAVAGMSMLSAHLSKPFDVRTETKVDRIEPSENGWQVTVETGEQFQSEALVLTTPAPQSIALLGNCAEPFLQALHAIDYDPCFALMVILDGPSRIPAPGYLRCADGPVEWIADNTQKGVSTGPAALTIHARADFSRRYLESPQEEIVGLLLEAAKIEGTIVSMQLHRWRYARPITASGSLCLSMRHPAPIAIAGDAFGGPRIEGAFLSGLAAGRFICSA